MKKHFNLLNSIYIVSLFLVFFIAMGVIPRQFAFLIVILYLYFIFKQPLEESPFLFARSIPFFIALPLTPNFDNFNTWRIILLAIFLKWFFSNVNYKFLLKKRFSDLLLFWKNYRAECLGIILLILATFSLFVASDLFASIKRVIYFANLAMIFVVVSSAISKNKNIFFLLAWSQGRKNKNDN